MAFMTTVCPRSWGSEPNIRSKCSVSAFPSWILECATLCWLCAGVLFLLDRGWPAILWRTGPREGRQAATVPSEASMAVQRPG